MDEISLICKLKVQTLSCESCLTAPNFITKNIDLSFLYHYFWFMFHYVSAANIIRAKNTNKKTFTPIKRGSLYVLL